MHEANKHSNKKRNKKLINKKTMHPMQPTKLNKTHATFSMSLDALVYHNKD